MSLSKEGAKEKYEYSSGSDLAYRTTSQVDFRRLSSEQPVHLIASDLGVESADPRIEPEPNSPRSGWEVSEVGSRARGSLQKKAELDARTSPFAMIHFSFTNEQPAPLPQGPLLVDALLN